jgi:hypothetical protein
MTLVHGSSKLLIARQTLLDKDDIFTTSKNVFPLSISFGISYNV